MRENLTFLSKNLRSRGIILGERELSRPDGERSIIKEGENMNPVETEPSFQPLVEVGEDSQEVQIFFRQRNDGSFIIVRLQGPQVTVLTRSKIPENPNKRDDFLRAAGTEGEVAFYQFRPKTYPGWPEKQIESLTPRIPGSYARLKITDSGEKELEEFELNPNLSSEKKAKELSDLVNEIERFVPTPAEIRIPQLGHQFSLN